MHMTTRSHRRSGAFRSLGIVLSLTFGASVASALAMSAPADAASTQAPAARTTKGTTTIGDRLVIPSISFSKPVVVGWTREINQGKITLVGQCWPGTPKTASLPCSTTWIAGHHTTHGSPFRNLPKVRIGAVVTIVHNGVASTYKVTSKISVSRATPPTWIFEQDLLLQCSDGANKAWAVNAQLIGSRPA